MTRALLGVVLLASLLAPTSATGGKSQAFGPKPTYSFRILDNPTTGDAFGFRDAIQQNAQGLSNKLFHSLASLLGGSAPALNFVPTGSQFAPSNMAANLTDRVGAPQGTINVDPLAVEALTNFKSQYHNSGTNGYPHEMAHLRQTVPVLAQLLTAEGGAQAFADLVTPVAAKRAGIPYKPGNYDGDYTDYVKAVQVAPYGRDWLLGGQFGKPPANWP